ncbi:MAG: hypothetical protein HYW25_05120 [Candidatus Aenigmarchaeota archaeon]|nr:hypothetical protein [Candidatus Aenigmarchaeota archaeon]
MRFPSYTLYVTVVIVVLAAAAGIFALSIPGGMTGTGGVASNTAEEASASSPEPTAIEEQAETQENTPVQETETPEEESQMDSLFVPVSDQPDLAVLSIEYKPQLPKTTEQVTFTALIQNIGGKAAQVRRYKLLPLVETASEISSATVGKDILQPGETTEIKSIWDIDVTGIITVVASIDVFDEVAEFDETNNELRIKFRMQPANGFVGCSSLKTNVCDSVLEVEPAYFENNPQCAQITCDNGPTVMCDSACPHPRE